jgi:hypothetical protein
MLKAKTAQPEKTPTARYWLSKYTSAETDMHATTEEMWEAEYSVWSIPRLYNEDHWDKSVSLGQKSQGDTLVVSQQAQLVIGHGH